MENTPRSKVRQDSPVKKRMDEIADRLRGVPLNMLCNVEAALVELGISEEYRTLLRKAGIPVLCRIGRVDVGLTDDIATFFKNLPELGEPPSVARKQRHLKRKRKAK